MKIDNIKMPEISEYLRKQEVERAKIKPKTTYMPTTEVIKNLPKKGVEQGFSYQALIEQSKEKESGAEGLGRTYPDEIRPDAVYKSGTYQLLRTLSANYRRL